MTLEKYDDGELFDNDDEIKDDSGYNDEYEKLYEKVTTDAESLWDITKKYINSGVILNKCDPEFDVSKLFKLLLDSKDVEEEFKKTQQEITKE